LAAIDLRRLRSSFALQPPKRGKGRSEPDRRKDTPIPQQAGQPHPVVKPYEQLIERGLLEIEALCYIRGRSIPNRFLCP
jgi:PhoH-like ATPase